MRSSLARVLTLAALLCVLGFQVAEAGHSFSHGVGDSASHCLLCKGSADTEAAFQGAIVPALVLAAIVFTAWAGFDVPTYQRAYQSRGPPHLL